VRLAHLGSATPWYDEFYHLLAAHSWLADGTLAIGSGEYTRAALFTRIVAVSMAVFGEGMVAGRVPAVVAGVLWVAAVFAWVRHVAGRGAAWAAGLLLALDPGAIHLSQWVRFYTLHGLLVWIGAISVYTLVARPPPLRRAVLVGLGGLAAFVMARMLLPTTLIALGGVGLWAMGFMAPRLPGLLAKDKRNRWLFGGALLALVATGAWALTSGTIATYWAIYTGTFAWQQGSEVSRRWYGWWLSGQYQTLWSLFPVAIVAAVARFPRPALFSLTVFCVSFLGVSFAAGQAERYLYFALPFFFVVWGLALATLVPALLRVGERALAAVGKPRFSPRWLRSAALAFTVLTVAFVTSQNDASRTTIRMVVPGDGPRPYRLADWELALPRLRPLVDSADVVVSTYLLKPIYYFGRGEYHLSYTETAESGFEDGRPVEFSVDRRTGRPTISTSESLALVIRCYPSGLVLAERFHLNVPHLVPEETTETLLANTTEVPMPPDSWVLAYRWRHDPNPDAAGCDRLGAPRPTPPLE
jgi:hypothetical protein